jgi:Tfp pilus assembly protein PilX
MSRPQRGSALVIAIVAVLVIAVIGVGLLRFTQRSVAFSVGGPRHKALVECAEAGRALIESRFHVLGLQPTEIAVMNETLDGPQGRMRALGGHIDADPALPLATIKQVERIADAALPRSDVGSGDLTNIIAGVNVGSGQALKVTVHCQEGDTSSPTSGRQMEIEYGVQFGL